jgi:hypothetical protein
MGRGTTGRPAGPHVCFTPDRVALTAAIALRATRDTPASLDASEKCDIQQIGAPFQNHGTRWGRSWMQRRIYCPSRRGGGQRCLSIQYDLRAPKRGCDVRVVWRRLCTASVILRGTATTGSCEAQLRLDLARHSYDWRTRARQRCCRRPSPAKPQPRRPGRPQGHRAAA